MEKIEIEPTIPLTESELVMLQTLVESPVWSTFRKVISNATAQWASSLSVSEDFNQMLRLQGRIQGANYMLSYLPMLMQAKQDLKVKKFPPRSASSPPPNSPVPA